jgi:hypothetical protein
MLAGCRLQDSKDKLNARINALRKFLWSSSVTINVCI